MTYVRRDAWNLKPNDDTLLWYARAVGELQKRDITDPTSWLYLAAIHGFSASLWKSLRYIKGAVPGPAKMPNREQCQHHTWYFLPWHRGYLGAFEAIVRAVIIGLNGPADWALPYWNYNSPLPQAATLPTIFRQKTFDGGKANPLYVDQRNNAVDLNQFDGAIDLTQALTDNQFEGPGGGGSPGFGGAATIFQHQGTQANQPSEGWLEQVPHDTVHGLVGGSGLMSDPDTAALDPIFWLHHSNIDRLWEVWLQRDKRDTNPIDPAWLTGPLVGGKFLMPRPDGIFFSFTAGDMLDTKAPNLDYVYEDISDPIGGATRLSVRAANLALIHGVTRENIRTTTMQEPTVELLGANESAIRLSTTAAQTTVKLDRTVRTKLAARKFFGWSTNRTGPSLPQHREHSWFQ